MTTRNAPGLLALMFAATTLVGCSSGGGGTPSYEVTASVNGTGGSVTPDSQKVKKGETAKVTVSADAANGYVIDTVTSSCGEPLEPTGNVTEAAYTTGAVTAACTVEASFKLATYNITTQAAPGGTLTAADTTVSHNGTTSFTVQADPGFAVSKVSASGCTIDPVTYETGAITADCTVTASFVMESTHTPVVLGYEIKQLVFTWDKISGASTYKLMKDLDGPTNATYDYVQVGKDVTATSAVDDIAVHLHDWPNTSYRVQACNATGCVDLNEVDTFDALVAYANATKAIGYVKASNTAAGDRFGTAVAVSGDGTTLAVGVPGKQYVWDPAVSASGGVDVYARSGTVWVHQQYLQASNADADDFFGGAVALSYDGNTLAIGAPQEGSGDPANTADNGTDDAGAVYVFSRDASNSWSEQAYLKSGTPLVDAYFGYALALSDDGSSLAVGAWGENNFAGAAYVFTRTEAQWSTPVRLVPAILDGVDGFGDSVALSGDGYTLAVGAPGESSTDGDPNTNIGKSAGAAYVFKLENGTWGQPDYLKASNIEDLANFGDLLSLNQNGTVLAVGAPQEDGTAGADSGAVYVFTHNGSDWGVPQYLKASNADAGDRFGYAVALSDDGTMLAVGAPDEFSAATGLNGDTGNTLNTTGAGAAYLFTRDDAGAWTEKTYIKAPNTGEGDLFGYVLALSSDGQTLVVGAEQEDSNATGICVTADDVCSTGQGNDGATDVDAGAAYLY